MRLLASIFYTIVYNAASKSAQRAHSGREAVVRRRGNKEVRRTLANDATLSAFGAIDAISEYVCVAQ